MDSIAELLGNLNHAEPPEMVAIKQYVRKYFRTVPGVTMQSAHIIITVPSASLAGALRTHLYQIQEYAKTTKRLVIRIGK
jgi:hypothetical protein